MIAAWPPISRARTWWFRKVERTLRIGFGVKRSSQGEIGFPEGRRGEQSLRRRQAQPFFGFVHEAVGIPRLRIRGGVRHPASATAPVWTKSVNTGLHFPFYRLSCAQALRMRGSRE